MNQSPSRGELERGTQNVATTARDNRAEVRRLLTVFKKEIEDALPKHLTAERMMRVALTALNQTPGLQRCSPETICGAVVQASILGLEPSSVLGECFLIPFYNKKANDGKGGHEAQLVVGYQGKIKLVANTGKLLGIKAAPVHKNDEFEFDDGIDPVVKHRYHHVADRGPVIGYWAGAKLVTGFSAVCFMTVKEVEQHRDKFAMTRSREGKVFGVWVDNFEAMALKTCIHKVLKYIPKSVEMQTGWNLDEAAEAGRAQKFSVDIPLALQPAPDDEGTAGLNQAAADGVAIPDATDSVHQEQAPDGAGSPAEGGLMGTGEPERSAGPAPISINDFEANQLKAIEAVLRAAKIALNRAQVDDYMNKWHEGKELFLSWCRDKGLELGLNVSALAPR